MAKKGTGLLMVWASARGQGRRLQPLVQRGASAGAAGHAGLSDGARYEAVKGGPKHLAYYELESPAVLNTRVQAGPGQSHRVDQALLRTDVHRHDVHPERLHDDPPQGAPGKPRRAAMAPVLQIGRMGVPPDVDADFNTWYSTIYVPNYEKVPGVIRGRRYRAVVGYAGLSDALRVRAPPGLGAPRGWPSATPSPERARSGQNMRHAPGSPGVYVKTFELSSDALHLGVEEVAEAVAEEVEAEDAGHDGGAREEVSHGACWR